MPRERLKKWQKRQNKNKNRKNPIQRPNVVEREMALGSSFQLLHFTDKELPSSAIYPLAEVCPADLTAEQANLGLLIPIFRELLLTYNLNNSLKIVQKGMSSAPPP